MNCHPYLISMLSADLLSLHLVTFLMFFILVYCVEDTLQDALKVQPSLLPLRKAQCT